MSENYPHLLTDIKPQIQEAQRTQRTINSPPKNIKTYHIQTVDNNAQTWNLKESHLRGKKVSILIQEQKQKL